MIKTLFTAIAFLFLTVCAKAQDVKGTVVDATTGAPIPRASVYLNGSSKGTTTNEQGEFTLYTDETKIPLVVSSVGYQSIEISDYSNKVLSIKLQPRVHVLREVVIGGMSREEQMKIFLAQFLGPTIAEDCFISNPDDINFIYRKKTRTLEADVSQPLIINNKKLGYKITYYLSSFSHSPIETAYRGNYVFEEDTLGLNAAEMEKIKRGRNNVYLGSRMHFIRSLWANAVKLNNFNVQLEGKVGEVAPPRLTYDMLVKTDDDEKYLSSTKTIIITYNQYYKSYIAIEPSGSEVFI